MRGPDAGEASSPGFDHRAEVIATQSALLLKMDSDGFQVVFGQGFMQQVAIGLGARFWCGGKRGVFRMRR
ncbi:MAG TPA: hypothetical protein VGN24_06255, partial [Rhodanobacter sp.]|nr:hypothetical protein [Rhodanobacter sp.]